MNPIRRKCVKTKTAVWIYVYFILAAVILRSKLTALRTRETRNCEKNCFVRIRSGHFSFVQAFGNKLFCYYHFLKLCADKHDEEKRYTRKHYHSAYLVSFKIHSEVFGLKFLDHKNTKWILRDNMVHLKHIQYNR